MRVGGEIFLRRFMSFDDFFSSNTLNSLKGYTEGQVLQTLESIPCPVLVIQPKEGWPSTPAEFNKRVDAVKNIKVVDVEGGHYCHLDDKSEGKVWEEVEEFLRGFE